MRDKGQGIGDKGAVERWMSTGTAAKALGVERTTAWRYAKEGHILAQQLPSGRWVVAFPIQKLREFDQAGKENVANVANVARG